MGSGCLPRQVLPLFPLLSPDLRSEPTQELVQGWQPAYTSSCPFRTDRRVPAMDTSREQPLSAPLALGPSPLEASNVVRAGCRHHRPSTPGAGAAGPCCRHLGLPALTHENSGSLTDGPVTVFPNSRLLDS